MLQDHILQILLRTVYIITLPYNYEGQVVKLVTCLTNAQAAS